jgi:hypothetical protein
VTCSKCGIDKAESAFPSRGRRCRECVRAWHADHYQKPEIKAKHREQGRRWRAENPARNRVFDLKSRLKTVYGMSLDDYRALLERQQGACAICKSPDPKRRKALGLFVDHCHKTGAVRGLLCHRCNLLIGFAEETPDRVLDAVSYLNRWKSKPAGQV